MLKISHGHHILIASENKDEITHVSMQLTHNYIFLVEC